MTEYYCNACGFEFSEMEADHYEHNDRVVICPMCGAQRWDDDDDSVIEKFNGEKEAD